MGIRAALRAYLAPPENLHGQDQEYTIATFTITVIVFAGALAVVATILWLAR